MTLLASLRAVLLPVLFACPPVFAQPAGDEAFPLVDVQTIDPTIRVELRYATADNFTGEVLDGYEANRAYLLPEAARALASVQRSLRRKGLGLKIYDAYRPVRATRAMVEWARRTGQGWLFDAGYIASRSGHNLGTTVDLTLVRLDTGEELDMGGAYDTFNSTAHTRSAAGQSLENRLALKSAMEGAGFSSYFREWWHFVYDLGTTRRFDTPIR